MMGRKTFESIGRPLPGRDNIVVTRNPRFNAAGITVALGIEAAMAAANMAQEIMVIGGMELYSAALPFADRIYLTEIHHDFDGDVFFSNVESSVV